MIKQLAFEKQAPDLATPENVAALEAQVCVRFPPAFVEFCSRWNGGFPSKENEFYPVPASFKQFYAEYGEQAKGILVHNLLGITETFRQCSWIKTYNLINEIGDLGIIPIANDLFGNQTVLRSNSPAGLVYWLDHDMPWEILEIPDPLGNVGKRVRLIPIAQDLECFYNSLTFDPDREQ